MTSLPITLPENCVLKVTVGSKVTEGQIIAQKKQAVLGKILPIAKFLKTPPNKTLKYLKKRPGDRVEKGEILAVISTDRKQTADVAANQLKSCIHIGSSQPVLPKTIVAFVDETGVRPWDHP